MPYNLNDNFPSFVRSVTKISTVCNNETMHVQHEKFYGSVYSWRRSKPHYMETKLAIYTDLFLNSPNSCHHLIIVSLSTYISGNLATFIFRKTVQLVIWVTGSQVFLTFFGTTNTLTSLSVCPVYLKHSVQCKHQRRTKIDLADAYACLGHCSKFMNFKHDSAIWSWN